MKKKLNLDIEESIIEKANTFSKNKGISLSDMVEKYLEFITHYHDEKEILAKETEISRTVEPNNKNNQEKNIQLDLEKKHQGNYTWQKVTLAIAFFGIATIGFMMKLPSVFQNYDKMLHALFYFLAAAFLNILFVKRNLIKHIAVFIFLALFGVAIEFAQEYSNKFFLNRIHGRHDIEDIKYNFYGLILFSIVWIGYTVIVLVFKNINEKEEI